MKIKKFKFKQILKLHFLNKRVYENNINKIDGQILTNSSLIETLSAFKKALHVIFQYHQEDKKILFIGVPKKLELKINKLTPHMAVPATFDIQGIISNNFKPAKITEIRKRSVSKIHSKSLFPKLIKKPDLVVLLAHEKKQIAFNESSLARIPLIAFDTTMNSNFYNLGGLQSNVVSTTNRNLLFFGLSFLFKKFTKKKLIDKIQR